MLSELTIKHAYEYGEKLADLMREKKVLQGKVYFSILTIEGEKALCFTHYPDGEPTNFGYIYIKDLLNAETDFYYKMISNFTFVIIVPDEYSPDTIKGTRR